MKIPKTISIGGIPYDIKSHDRKLTDSKGWQVDGKAHIEEQFIELSFNKLDKKDYKDLVFLHELTHLLFYYAGTGKSKLWANEQEVHNFSVLLHQVIKQLK